MKKLFTVLAVLLVASVAFAAVISGTVKAEYKFDFDERTITYSEPGVGSLDATLKIDPTEAIIVGDAEATHIEAKVVAGIDLQYNAGNNHDTEVDYYPLKNGLDYFWFKNSDDTIYAGVILDVDTFKIVGKDWSVDFTGSLGLDFAKSAIDSKRFHKDTAEDNTQYYSFDNSVKGKHNLKATFLGYSVGFGMGTEVLNSDKTVKHNDWTDGLNFAVTATTPSYTFGDFSFAVGAGYEVVDHVWAVAASAKAAYATDKVSVSGAYDAKVVNPSDAFVSNDLALNVAVAPVTVDVYFNNEGAAVADKYAEYYGYMDPTTHEYKKAKAVGIVNSNYLSAKVTVDVAKVAENVPVTVTVGGYNLIGDETQILDGEVSTTIVPNFKFGAYFKDWCDFETGKYANKDGGKHRKAGATVEFTGIQNVTLTGELAYAFAREDGNKALFAEVGAAYAHELFDAEATISMKKPYDQEALFGANLEASSTKLVDGAKLYAQLQFDLNGVIDDTNTNMFAAGCKVSF